MDLNLHIGTPENKESYHPFNENSIYDIIIIGGGPAGLTAAVYCMRKGLNTGIIIKQVGGQVADTAGIENYMGYRYISGLDLTDKFRSQVTQFGISYEEFRSAVEITPGSLKQVTLDDGRILSAKALIIATGKSWKKLNVPGEKRLTGHGVAYCATCDGPLYAGKDVVIVGGGNSGLEAVIDIAPIATHVTLVQFLDHLTADRILQKKILEFENLTVLLSHQITEIIGDTHVTAVTIENRKTQESTTMDTSGVFIEIGLVPNSGFVRGVLDLNRFGEIITDKSCRTSSPGIFAAGDVTTIPYKQIIIAAGEGSTAALAAHEYILQNEV